MKTEQELEKIIADLNNTSPECLSAIDELCILRQSNRIKEMFDIIRELNDENSMAHLNGQALFDIHGEMQARIDKILLPTN